jgi:DNA-binding Xre family transcriptional regulator
MREKDAENPPKESYDKSSRNSGAKVIMEVARATGVSRNMLSKLYFDRARRVDLEDMAKLCDYLQCSLGDLFETVR